MSTLEQQLAADANEALAICIKRHDYNATGIQTMILRRQSEGWSIVDAAEALIHEGDAQSGLTRLWEISQQPGCEDVYKLTIEWLVAKPEYQSLFTEETIAVARKRLHDYFGV